MALRAVVGLVVLLSVVVVAGGPGPAFVGDPVASVTTGIAGTVSSPSGPVAHVVVEVRAAGAGSGDAPDYQTDTDAEGRYEVTTAPGTWDVYVKPGVGSQLDPFVSAGVTVVDGQVTTVDAALVPTGSVIVSGVVRNGSGDAAGAGVQVDLYGTDGAFGTAQTGADGSYAVYVPPGAYDLSVGQSEPRQGRVPSFTTAHAQRDLTIDQDRQLDLTLPGGTQTVLVLDPSGNPVAGAGVSVRGDAGPAFTSELAADVTLDLAGSWWAGSFTTDSSGTVEVPVFPTGAIVVVIPPADSSQGYASRGFTPSPGGTLTVTVPTKVLLSGVVLTAGGRAVDDLRLDLLGAGPQVSTTTGPDGRYSVNVVPGDYEVRLDRATDSQDSSLVPQFETGPGSGGALTVSGDQTLDLTLPGGVQSFRVQDEDGNPVAGAAVAVQGDDLEQPTFPSTLAPGFTVELRGDWTSGELETDAAGVVELPVFPSAAQVHVRPPDGSRLAPARVSFTPSAGGVLTVTLPTAVVLSGVIRSGAGSPVGGALLTLNNGETDVTVTTDGDGIYSVQVIPGEYVLSLNSSWQSADVPNFSSAFPAPDNQSVLQVSEDRTLDLTLPGGLQTFHVQDGDGSPLAGASVRVTGDYDNPFSFAATLAPGLVVALDRDWSTVTLTTDASGDVVLPVFPTNARVFVRPPEGSGLADTVIRFTPEPGGTLTVLAGIPPAADIFVGSRSEPRPWARAGESIQVGGENWSEVTEISAALCAADGTSCDATSISSSDLQVFSGNLSGTVVLSDSAAPGARSLRLSQGSATATTPLIVLAPPALTFTPSPGVEGTIVAVTGSGFSPRTTVFIASFDRSPGPNFDDTPTRLSPAVLVDDGGEFTQSLTVPSTTTAIAATNGEVPPDQEIVAHAPFNAAGEPRPTSSTFEVAPVAGEAYQTVTMTCTVAANSGLANGTATFLEGDVVLASTPVVDGAPASVTVSSLGPGTHSLTCEFAGSAPFQGSQANHTSATYTSVAAVPDEQTVTVGIPQGVLTITTPYTPANPLSLGTAVLDQSDSTYSAEAQFGTAADGYITVNDTRAGNLGWTASLVSGVFTGGGASFGGQYAGLTGVTAMQKAGNAMQAGAVVETDSPPNSPGLAAQREFARYPSGLSIGSVDLTGLFGIDAVPTSTVAGIYTATVTFTAI